MPPSSDTDARDPDPQRRAAALADPNLPLPARMRLVGDPSPAVRAAFARTPPDFDGSGFTFSRTRHSALALVRPDDAEFIVRLRTDPRLNRHLSAVDADPAQQRDWIARYLQRERRLEEFYFLITGPGRRPLGAVRLYGFRPGSFGWGSWIVDPAAPRTTAIESALNVYEFAFGSLGFPAAHFEVRNDNRRVVAFHEKMGAQPTHADDTETFFTLPRDAYTAARLKYARLLTPDAAASSPTA